MRKSLHDTNPVIITSCTQSVHCQVAIFFFFAQTSKNVSIGLGIMNQIKHIMIFIRPPLYVQLSKKRKKFGQKSLIECSINIFPKIYFFRYHCVQSINLLNVK